MAVVHHEDVMDHVEHMITTSKMTRP